MLKPCKDVLFILATVAFGVLHASSDEPRTPSINGSIEDTHDATLETVPLMGVVESSSPQPTEIKLPDVFLNDELKAKIRIRNTFTAGFRITAVKTSCGCTTVTYDHTEISPGASAIVAFGIAPSKVGPYGVKVSIRTSYGDIPVQLSGRTQPRLLLDPQRVTLTVDGEFDVPVIVYDERLRTSRWYFSMGDEKLYPILDEARNMSIRIKSGQHSHLTSRTLVPVVDDVLLPPQAITLRKPGEIQLITKDVTVTKEYLDLVFRGDVMTAKVDLPILHQNGKDYLLKAKRIEGSGAMFLRCAVPEGLQNGDAIIKLGKLEFKCSVVMQ